MVRGVSSWMWRSVAGLALVVGAALALGASAVEREEGIAVKPGEKIAFLGDSITQLGAGSPVGYVNLVMSGLEANGVKAVAMPAGISGHKSNDMLARLKRDVLDKKPDWMTLSCGVNDVWHGPNGVPLDRYKENITKIVEQAQAADIKVMILTSTMIGEDQPNGNNQKLIEYNNFLRTLAKEKQCLLADLNADMQAAVKAAKPDGKGGNALTADGVHMNPQGNVMMASGILRAWGVDAAGLAKAQAAWLDVPRAVDVGRVSVSLRQYQQLTALAAKQKVSVADLVNAETSKAIEGLLKQAGEAGPAK